MEHFRSSLGDNHHIAAVVRGLALVLVVQAVASLLYPTSAGTPRNAHEYATTGDGSDLSPWKGWEAAFAADTEVIFNKGFFESPVSPVTVPSGSALRGVDGSILRWPVNRTQINPMLTVPAGNSNVVIRGLQFEPGVSVPQIGVSSQGGASYIQIGDDGASTTCSNIRIEDNRFGIMRYNDAQGGTDVHVRSSIDGFIFRGNTLDAAPSSLMFDGSHPTVQYTYRHLLISDNMFLFTQTHHNFGYAIYIGNHVGYTVPARIEQVSIVGNAFRFQNGTIYITGVGHGVSINGNNAVSDNMDWLAGWEAPAGFSLDDVQVVGNTCYAYAPTDPLRVQNPGCLIKGIRTRNAVVSGNVLTSPSTVSGVAFALATNVLASNNLVDVTGVEGHSFSRCFHLQQTAFATFDNNVCANPVNEAAVVLAGIDDTHDIAFTDNELRTTVASPVTANFVVFDYAVFGGVPDRIVLRGNRIAGQNLTGAFRTGTVTNVNEIGNITSVADPGWRIGSDAVSDITGDGLQLVSGALGVTSGLTKDSEWDTASETNAATTDVDFVVASDGSITRDSEWDTVSEINARTTDDDFTTLTGVAALTNKDLASSTNTFPRLGVIGFTASNVSGTLFSGPNTALSNSTEAFVSQPTPAVVANNLSCKATQQPGAGKSWTLTLRSAGADTALTCTISGTAQDCTDATHAVTLSDGAELSLKTVRGGTPPATVLIGCVMQVRP